MTPRVQFGALVCDGMNNGLSPSTKGTVPGRVLTLSAITRDAYEPNFCKEAFFDKPASSAQTATAGTFLVCRGNGNRQLVGVGRVATPADDPPVFPDTMIGARLDLRRVLPKYLELAWATEAVRSQIEAAARTTNGTYKINQQALSAIEVPLPPLAEQRRIAEILDRADSIRRKRQQAIALTEDLLRSVFLDMFGDPVTNPKGWPWVPMASLIASSDYGTAKRANEDGRGLPILRMNNLTSAGGIDLTDVKWVELEEGELEKCTTRRGDLLFNRTNSPDLVGKTAVWDREERYAIAGYLVRIRFTPKKAAPDYVSGFLNSAHGKRYLFTKAKPSNNMSNFSAGEFKRIPIPQPPIALQQEYAKAVASVRSVQERMRAGQLASEDLFHSLVQRAFRGEL